jgi:D-amino-acid dehydrogenase
MFRRDSAVYIKPRWDPRLWAWLARFAAGCRRGPMLRRAQARHALLASSMQLYRQLLAEESRNVEWEDRGLLVVHRSPHSFDEFRKVAAFLGEEFGIVATPYDRDQLLELEPALKSGPAGGWHFPGDAHLRPDRLMRELASNLSARGVEFAEGIKATRFNVENGVARALTTTGGLLEADYFALAIGAETPAFAQQLGCVIPIQPGKGYSITFGRSGTPPSIPLIFEEHHVAVTPWASGVRIGSTMEFAGYDDTINQRRIDLFKRAVVDYLKEPPDGQVEEEWCGWRPMTYDDLPYIDRAPKLRNVIVAAGHGMIGMSTATASGKLAAELISGTEPHIDPSPYSLCRFKR